MRYPVYIPSKGRADVATTPGILEAGGVDFRLVVEPPEADAYAKRFGRERVLELPFADLGQGSIPARNWIWDRARQNGVERHWVLDDNLAYFRRLHRGKRIECAPAPALRVCEDFVDRYENVAIGGLAYTMFVTSEASKPFLLNVHVYSCMLVRTDLGETRWRGRYNEDTDLCLQVLSEGWCTVLLQAFAVHKQPTMTMKGGNTDELYAADGRLRMARDLERAWPGVVTVSRRYGRPQHVVNWKKFDHQLRRRPDFDPAKLPATNEYGLELRAKREVRSESLRRYYEEARSDR